MRVVAAMSGGVDSAVAAARMVAAGHEVVGVHLALARVAAGPRGKGCCSIRDAADARRVADRLGIPFYIWDLSEDFERDVVADFVAQYAAGRTPNPCLRCNERIKFAALLDRALAFGFEALATGHYARIVPAEAAPSGRRELHRAVDPAKDQSYVLGVLDAGQLASALFPLGGSLKGEVRREAESLGLGVASKPDSHDICFIPDGDTRGWLGGRLETHPGPILEVDGTQVGEHDGAVGYTVGQRRGLAIRRPSADGRPRYVVSTDPVRNTVVVGPEELLGIDEVTGEAARWCGPAPTGPTEVGVQLRAHGEELPGVVRVDGARADRVTVGLHRRARAVAPGQAVVLYSGTRVVGSATITATGLRCAPRRAAP